MRVRLALREEASVHDATRAAIALKAGTEGPPLETYDKSQPEVFVLFTTRPGTIAALKRASQLSAKLGVHLEALMLYDVPHTLPLDERALPEGFLEDQMRAFESNSPAGMSLRVILCRHSRRTLRQILPARALIVLGGKKCWWPTRESRLARMLRGNGHEVVFAESR
jgi:hypothetical protein